MISFREHGEENRIFKATMTVLLFFFNLLHWSCFVSLSQGLPHIDALRMESEIELNSVAGKINSIIPMNHNLHQVREFFVSNDFYALNIRKLILWVISNQYLLIISIFFRHFSAFLRLQDCFVSYHQCASKNQYFDRMWSFSVPCSSLSLAALSLFPLKDW